jgi:hypothetical protein
MMGGSTATRPDAQDHHYRAFIGRAARRAGSPPLSIVILDQFGKLLADFTITMPTGVHYGGPRDLAIWPRLPRCSARTVRFRQYDLSGNGQWCLSILPVGGRQRIIARWPRRHARGGVNAPVVWSGRWSAPATMAGLLSNQRVDFVGAVDAEGLLLSEMD